MTTDADGVAAIGIEMGRIHDRRLACTTHVTLCISMTRLAGDASVQKCPGNQVLFSGAAGMSHWSGEIFLEDVSMAFLASRIGDLDRSGLKRMRACQYQQREEEYDHDSPSHSIHLCFPAEHFGQYS